MHKSHGVTCTMATGAGGGQQRPPEQKTKPTPPKKTK